MILDEDDEIEISLCNISYAKNSDSDSLEYSIGYRLKFNKYTKYVYPNHRFDLMINKDVSKYVRLRLWNTSIQFKCFNRTCVNTRPYKPNEFDPMSTELVYPCQTDSLPYSETKETCTILKREVIKF
ncbi:hypothetical protein RF11_13004 [Thelohanellus kitauei]|uniref:Uncharacterized protein n=1 Tax=Thelohanellus kitauei TaxID=669202 RepID=A0A0C2MRC6_THEKT|nr:hypothetical protein RF11_13004 [Thelohanellus kitauei]